MFQDHWLTFRTFLRSVASLPPLLLLAHILWCRRRASADASIGPLPWLCWTALPFLLLHDIETDSQHT